jgi:SWIM/SEC-C metal-binding protein
MAKIFQKGPAMKRAEQSKTNFEVKKTVRLGTGKAPAQISVQTPEREQELAAICAENGWVCVIEVNSDEDENIRDLESLQNKQTRAVSTKMANRNDPCPCGSGKKYKKCCGAQPA